MIDAEIIKALECCSEYKTFCDECSYRLKRVEYCDSDLLKDAVALINRQKAEIDILIRKKDTLRDEVAEQQAEIERLKQELDGETVKNMRLEHEIESLMDSQETYGKNRVKEFWEKTKQTREYRTCPYVYVVDGDNLIKEME